MPEVVMNYVSQSTARGADISRHINELRASMDLVVEGLDGFSDSDSSLDEFDHVDCDRTILKSKPAHGDHRKHHCKKGTHLKHNSTAKRHAAKLHRAKSHDEKKVTHSTHGKHGHLKKLESGDIDNKTEGSEHCDRNEILLKDVLECYDSALYEPIRAGQDAAEADIPIMSPPPEVESATSDRCRSSNSSRYGRAMSLHFLMVGENTPCEFDTDKYMDSNKALLNISEKVKTPECICCLNNTTETGFGGWEVGSKYLKSRNGKRRKSVKPQSSEIAFDRLTGAAAGEKNYKVQFQHYRNTSKYIESYRILHTVDNAGRPFTAAPPTFVKKSADTNPYYDKRNSTICAMATTCDIYSLLSPPKRDANSPVSSNDSGHEKVRSDEDSYDDSGIEFRAFTVRDRGKSLNLAPVRECTVPEFAFKDRQDQYQQNYVALNQYLNLMTPPLPAHGLQFEIDEAKMRQNGFRIMNTGDNNLFPACTPRRGARPLRLGSAEFLKPGSNQKDVKWSQEKRSSSGSLANPTSTVPGTIIVGSTVIPQASSNVQSRARNTGKHSPYVQFQKEQVQIRQSEKPQTPPQHVSGKKFKPCERVTDLTSSAKNRFTYTHGTPPERPVVQYRSATLVDWDDKCTRRAKPVKLGVNHLGIRGHTFKPDEPITLYKHRRTATLKS